MRCKQCGEDFPNLNALTKHKKVCPGKPMEELDDSRGVCIIPIHLLPEEYNLFASGQSIAFRVICTHTPAGGVVQEVTLIR